MAVTPIIERVSDELLNLAVSKTIAPDDQMFAPGNERHYFGVGKSASLLIANALLTRSAQPGGAKAVEAILDFGCGHGRVARYLRALFPTQRIVGTDYNDAGVAWCAKEFGYQAMKGPLPSAVFDLIWLGSVFTHLPEAEVGRLIKELRNALRPSGILIFTTQGRHSARRIEKALKSGEAFPPWLSYNLSNEYAENLVKNFSDGRYAYVDYPGQTGYGVSIVPLRWYMDDVAIDDECVVLSISEKAWDGHQDVVVIMKSDLLSIEKGAYF